MCDVVFRQTLSGDWSVTEEEIGYLNLSNVRFRVLVKYIKKKYPSSVNDIYLYK